MSHSICPKALLLLLMGVQQSSGGPIGLQLKFSCSLFKKGIKGGADGVISDLEEGLCLKNGHSVGMFTAKVYLLSLHRLHRLFLIRFPLSISRPTCFSEARCLIRKFIIAWFVEFLVEINKWPLSVNQN